MSSSQSFTYNSSVLFKCSPGSKGLCFCITKKYGNAVQRNLLKRRARYIFHSNAEINQLFSNTLYITPLKHKISFLTLQKAFLNLHKHFTKS